MAEKNYAYLEVHEYRDLVEDSCMNYRRGQVIGLIGDTIKRNLEGKDSIRSRYSKYGVACKDPDTVIDCILTILEIVDPWTFRQIINDWPAADVHMQEDAAEDDILPDSAEVEECD